MNDEGFSFQVAGSRNCDSLNPEPCDLFPCPEGLV